MSVKRYLNIKSFTFAPQGGSVITFLGCQQLTIAVNSSIMKASGDSDPGPSSIDMDYQEPVVSLKFEDIEAALIAPLDGKRGTVTAVVGLSGSSTGGMQIVLTPAVAITKQVSGAYRKYSDADMEFHGIFQDGADPLTCTLLPGLSQATTPSSAPAPAAAGPGTSFEATAGA